MNCWKKLKQANDTWKKFVIFCLLAILAVLLFLLVGHNFNKELSSFDKQKIYQIFQLDKLQQAKDSLQTIQEMAKQQASSTVATSTSP